MKLLDKCPRCDSVWTKTDNELIVECKNCKITYNNSGYDFSNPDIPRYEKSRWISYRDFLKLGDKLVIDFEDNCSRYYEYSLDKSDKIAIKTTLPLVSIDITPAKLKLYLLFS